MKKMVLETIHKQYVRRPEGADLYGTIRPRFLDYHRLTVDRDCEYPLHRHDEYELVWVEDGPYYCCLNGEELELKNRQVLVIKPGDLHQDHFKKGQSHFVLHFTLNDDLFGSSIRPKSQIGIGEIGAGARIFKEMASESSDSTGSDRFSGSLQDALLETLFWQTLRLLPASALSDTFNLYSRRQEFVAGFYSVLTGSFRRDIPVEEMASRMGVSKRTLSLQCRKYLKNSPAKLALIYRIDHGARLLAEGRRSVKEVSAYLGFDNPFNFSRVFKRVKGVSPSEYKDPLKG